MNTLHLGVTVVPYQRGRKGIDTGEVAEILEERYGIMTAFWKAKRSAYLDWLVAASVEALEARLEGRAVRSDPRTVLGQLQADFRRFISQREVERVGLKGVPTKAALRGVNHRFKHPYAKGNARRPSFRDTGLYEASFRAWLTSR